MRDLERNRRERDSGLEERLVSGGGWRPEKKAGTGGAAAAGEMREQEKESEEREWLRGGRGEVQREVVGGMRRERGSAERDRREGD